MTRRAAAALLPIAWLAAGTTAQAQSVAALFPRVNDSFAIIHARWTAPDFEMLPVVMARARAPQ